MTRQRKPPKTFLTTNQNYSINYAKPCMTRMINSIGYWVFQAWSLHKIQIKTGVFDKTGEERGACTHFLLMVLWNQRMVPGNGIEPSRYFYRGILSPLRLPISPPGLFCWLFLREFSIFCVFRHSSTGVHS